MIIGRFYFKPTASGNLIGEFSNNTLNRNCTEGADRIYPASQSVERTYPHPISFVGEYYTTWNENSSSQVSKMVIYPKTGCTNILTIEWTDLSSKKIMFWGEGMIVGDMLIGDYRNQPSIP